MTRAQEKPPVRGGSTATINRLRQAMAESAAARAGRLEPRLESAQTVGEKVPVPGARPSEPVQSGTSSARSYRQVEVRHRAPSREAPVQTFPEPEPYQPEDDVVDKVAHAVADREPPRTDRQEDQAGYPDPAVSVTPARDETSEHEDRLAQLRRMARRLAAESQEVGDLRRIDRTVAARPVEAEIETGEAATPEPHAALRSRRTASLTKGQPQRTRPGHTHQIYPAEVGEAPAPERTVTPTGAHRRDEVQTVAPADSDPHDARNVLAQVGRAPARRLPVIIGLVAIMLTGVAAVGAYRLLGAPGLPPGRSAAAPQRPALALEPIVEADPARSAPAVAKFPRPLPPAPANAPEQVGGEPQSSPAAVAEAVERPLAAAPVVTPPPSPPATVDSQPPSEQQAGPRLTAAQARQVRSLMTNAKNRLASGDVTSARALYQRAAELGDGTAAFALAETFDAAALARNGVTGVRADVSAARRWYRLAADRGVADAKTALARLQGSR